MEEWSHGSQNWGQERSLIAGRRCCRRQGRAVHREFRSWHYAAASIAVAFLENNPERVKKIVLVNAGMWPRYLPTGHLVYVANGTLHAVPFDVDRLEVRGTATPVLEDISGAVAFGSAQLDFSQSGNVLYRSGRTPGRTVVQWLTGDGKTEPLWDEPAFYQFAACVARWKPTCICVDRRR